MTKKIDVDAILSEIPGENSAGEDLRYVEYDNIQRARTEEYTYNAETMKDEVTKRAEWGEVVDASVKALLTKSKDLQIAAWLTEALVKTGGFDGLLTGLEILDGFISKYWDNVYPEIDDGDLDYRVGPFEFLNKRLPVIMRDIPITDPERTPGYSWMKYEESRKVGYEADTHDKKTRNALIDEGKLTPEDFDIGVENSPAPYYQSLSKSVASCCKVFKSLDQTLLDKFGAKFAPGLGEIEKAINMHAGFLERTLKNKTAAGYVSEPEAEEVGSDEAGVEEVETMPVNNTPAAPEGFLGSGVSGGFTTDESIWVNALKILKASGVQKALGYLYNASCSMPSVRDKNRCRLLMTKLCLKAKRPDLARPIVEELYLLIEELHLDRWEHPTWIAEVFDALHMCLMSGKPSNEDLKRADELFKRICTTDVTKAIVRNLK